MNNKTKLIDNLLMYFFLAWITFNGYISIVRPSIGIKSIKDIILVLLIVISFFYIYSKDKSDFRKVLNVCIFLSLVVIIGLVDCFGGASFSNFLFGLKITFLPILAFFIGDLFKLRNLDYTKPVLLIYILIVGVWFIQNSLGIEFVLSQGYEYGIGVKHFYGALRLPSIVGTPDGYSNTILVFAFCLEYSFRKNKNALLLLRILTIVFLYLATIRSSLILFLIYLLLKIFLIPIFFHSRKRTFQFMIALPVIILLTCFIYFYFVSGTRLLSTNSLVERLGVWSQQISFIFKDNWITGLGIGSVGAAAQTVARYQYLNAISLDNQYLALIIQVGIIGMILTIMSIVSVLKGYNILSRNGKQFILSLIIPVFLVSFFGNMMELYPFAPFFFMLLGYIYRGEGGSDVERSYNEI